MDSSGGMLILLIVIVFYGLWAYLFYRLGLWAGKSHDWPRWIIAIILAMIFGTLVGWITIIIGLIVGHRRKR